MAGHGTPLPKHTTPKMSGPPTLMTLPVEIRVVICEYVLFETSETAITLSFKQPALLQVNRTIRNEMRGPWYNSHTFKITIHDYDASVRERFGQHFIVASRPRPCPLRVSTYLSGAPHWANLMAWCRGVHAGDVFFKGGYEESADAELDDNDSVAVAALKLARTMKGGSAEDAQGQTLAWEAFRKVAGVVDRRWLEDK